MMCAPGKLDAVLASRTICLMVSGVTYLHEVHEQ